MNEKPKVQESIERYCGEKPSDYKYGFAIARLEFAADQLRAIITEKSVAKCRRLAAAALNRLEG